MSFCCLCIPVAFGSTPFYLCLAYALLLAEGLWYWFAYGPIIPLAWEIVVLSTASVGLVGAIAGTSGLQFRWGRRGFIALACWGMFALLLDFGYLVVDAVYTSNGSFNCYFCGYASESLSIAIVVLLDLFCIVMPQANAIRTYYFLAHSPSTSWRAVDEGDIFDLDDEMDSDDDRVRRVTVQPVGRGPNMAGSAIKPARPSRRPYAGLEEYELESEEDPSEVEREASRVPRGGGQATSAMGYNKLPLSQ